jgi:hypothetical protein
MQGGAFSPAAAALKGPPYVIAAVYGVIGEPGGVCPT